MTPRRIVAMIAAVGAVAAALTVGTTPAVAADAPGNWYHLTNGTTGGTADVSFAYGRADDEVHVGDWNGDATDTLGVRRGATYYLTNGTTGGNADVTFTYGWPEDTVLVGDWDGDGVDTLGVRRGQWYHLTNGTTGGKADISFAYGKNDDVVLVGDWDGDGKDTLGVRRGSSYYLTNGTTGGQADITFAYGKAADVVLVGDWNGDATDTLGVRRGSSYYLTSGTTGGAADITFAYGRSTDVVLVGDWDGDGTSTLGVRRPAVVRATIPAIPWNVDQVSYAVPSQVAPGLYRSTSFDYVNCSAETRVPMGSWDYLYSIQGSDPGQPTYVRIPATAIRFSEGRNPNDGTSLGACEAWTEVLPTDRFEPRESGSRGIYRTGHDIVPGTYRFDGWRNCTITAGRDFDGSPTSTLASIVVGSTTSAVELLPSYKGVTAAGFVFDGTACDWTKGTAG